MGRGYAPIKGFKPRPAAAVLNSITVEWRPAERDPLGNYCRFRGQLRFSDKTVVKPVDWFQGVTVYLASLPGKQRDWSNGLVNEAEDFQDKDVALATTVKPDGTFEASVDLRQLQSQRGENQEFQIGLVLAQHIGDYQEHKVNWDTKDPVIPSTVRMFLIPAATRLPLELELINRANGWPESNPNSVNLIRAVNALRPLGKQRALATLEKYVELLGEHATLVEQEVIFWIIRLLFEPVALGDAIPVPGIGMHLLNREAPESALWPLNPMEVVNDIPFMVGRPYGFEGEYESPALHIARIRIPCVLREHPLSPTLNPLVAAEMLLSSPKFKRLGNLDRKSAIESIRKQALAMVPDLLEPLPERRFFDDPSDNTVWQERLAKARALRIEWDPQADRFVSRGNQ